MVRRAKLLLFFLFSATCLASVYPGFVSEDTVWVGGSPALQYLLRCGLVERRNSGLSTDDIYSKKTLQSGVRKLQKLMGLQQTGFLDNKVMKIVHQGKCLGKKQKLRLKSAGCQCLGLVDRFGGGECRGLYGGYRWCYVAPESNCPHQAGRGRVRWSYSPCQNKLYYL